MADRAIESSRGDVQPSLLVFIAGSVALHAALLALVPGFNQEPPAPVRLSALEVVMRVPAESLSPIAEESVPHSAPANRPRPAPLQRPQVREMAAESAPSASRARPEITLPGSSDARTDTDRSPEAATARTPEALTAVPAEKAAAPEAPTARAVASAAYLDNPAPLYPEVARRMGQEGTVMLRVLVTADGAAAQVALERTSGSPHLDGAALERVRNWRFRPARLGTAPVESWVIVPIVFRLERAS